MSKQIRYYSSFTDDFAHSADQEYRLPPDYRWVRKDIPSMFLSGLIYGLAVIFGGLYCRCFLHVKVKGREKLKAVKGGFFLYGNHTQPVGDVFIPAIAVLPRRIFTVVSPANYGIPVIGKILPYLGALPTEPSVRGMKALTKAMEYRLEKDHPIVIYPEAHVWEYYTDIRPFPDAAFKFPVKYDKPAFAMTVTYQRSRFLKKPRAVVYLDGPFYPEGDTPREKVSHLHDRVYNVMKARSCISNFAYIEYHKAEEQPAETIHN